jgi:hypothetical protein
MRSDLENKTVHHNGEAHYKLPARFNKDDQSRGRQGLTGIKKPPLLLREADIMPPMI